MHTIIKGELQKLTKILQKKLDFRDINYQLKLEIFTKLKKRTLSPLAFWFMKTKKNIQSMCQKNYLIKNMLIYY